MSEPLYYAVKPEMTPPGKVITMAATDYTHEAIIVNNELDLAHLRLVLGRELLPLRSAPPKIPPPPTEIRLSPEGEAAMERRAILRLMPRG